MTLNRGEETVYDVYFKWGILMPRAGEARLTFDDTADSHATSLYRLTFATTRFFDTIYRMRDTLGCYYAPDLTLLHAVKHADEGNYPLTDELTFTTVNQQTLVRSHRYTPAATRIDTQLVSPSGYVFDMFGTVFYLRTLDWNRLRNGDRLTSKVAIGRDLVRIICTYRGRTLIRHEKQTYRTHRFTVDIHDDTFDQTKSPTEIWIGDDDNHLPLKIRSKLKIGAAEIHYKSSSNLKTPLRCTVGNE
jgi:hypothetical protein